MLDVLHRALLAIGWWFHPDIAHGVFWGSLVATFVASVMGDEQNTRLKNGTFGAVAGTSLGGLAGLFDKQPDLVVVGFVGSTVGGFIGWLYYVFVAHKAAQDPKWKSFVEFQVGGLAGLRNELNFDSKHKLKDGFELWSENFGRLIVAQRKLLLKTPVDAAWVDFASAAIQNWQVSAIDTLGLVFWTIKDDQKTKETVQYQSRVTLIIYGADNNGHWAGKHWLSYAGQLKPHSTGQIFDATSIGYKVLSGQLKSPYFTTSAIARKEGQLRADDPSYRPFITFRLTDYAILAVDWAEQLTEDDAYVQAARSLFYAHITPAITEVLERWPTPLPGMVGLSVPAGGAGAGGGQAAPQAQLPGLQG